MRLTVRLVIAAAFGFTSLSAVDSVAQTPRERLALGDGPWTFDTYEPDTPIRVTVIAKGLSHPFSIAFLPDGNLLVTERSGRLRIIRDGVLEPEPITGIPAVKATQAGGLLDLALSPTFAEDRLVYLTYSKATDKGTATAVARGRWDGAALVGAQDIFVADPSGGIGRVANSRLIFGRDGNLFVTVGGAGADGDRRAQDPGNYAGKILRLRPDGSVPPDNPFVGKPAYRPEIYSLGHRNPTGLAIHPATGALWESEAGPQGGDEVNIILPGRNYGWPVVTYGRNYDGSRLTEQPGGEGFEAPLLFWVPSITSAGLTFYTGNAFPAWHGNLFVAGLIEGRLRGAGLVQRIVLSEHGELRRESFFRGLEQRFRDIRQGPDGLLYALTDEDPGDVLRIEPAEARGPKNAENGVAASSARSAAAASGWEPSKTPWGDPDIQGMWPIGDWAGVPLTRPEKYGDSEYVTDAEYEKRVEQAKASAQRYAQENASDRIGGGHWAENGQPKRRNSLIVDPKDGSFPALTPAAEAKSKTMGSSWFRSAWDRPEDFDSFDRCITRGLPASMIPAHYNNGIEIIQTPGYVVIRFEMIHEARIIPIDAPPVDAAVTQWLGVPHGHWEGNTLVVETTNFNGLSGMMTAGPAGTPRQSVPTSTAMRVIERLTRISQDEMAYSMTVDDPIDLVQPWTMAYAWTREPGYRMFEYACHEGNEQVRNYIETSRYARVQAH
jgi:glucose/arabinose dehydrogenase